MDHSPQSSFEHGGGFESRVVVVSDIPGVLDDGIPDFFKYCGQGPVGGATHPVEGLELPLGAFEITGGLREF